jgi:hypothetical protein
VAGLFSFEITCAIRILPKTETSEQQEYKNGNAKA